jgi:hypothetical protein
LEVILNDASVPRAQTMETFKKARAEILELPERPTHHSGEICDPR